MVLPQFEEVSTEECGEEIYESSSSQSPNNNFNAGREREELGDSITRFFKKKKLKIRRQNEEKRDGFQKRGR